MIRMTYETYKLSQGKIVIAHSNKRLSVGYLVLNSGKELKKHNRPVLEQLHQIRGTCTMILFNRNSRKEVILNEGNSLDIPPKQFHIHANRSNEESITFWKANGDITEIINDIRKKSEM